jgi:hypothetical protein
MSGSQLDLMISWGNQSFGLRFKGSFAFKSIIFRLLAYVHICRNFSKNCTWFQLKQTWILQRAKLVGYLGWWNHTTVGVLRTPNWDSSCLQCMWLSFTESEFWVLENLSIWWRRNRLLRLDNCLNFTLQSPNSLFNLWLMCWSWARFLHSQEWTQKKSWGPTLWNVAPESNISFNCHLYHEIS